jgi:hypothetical protein
MRTLDFYACAMFNARQARHETVAAWCSRIDQLISNRRLKCAVSQLGRACFIQGPANERIRTVVRARSPTHITEATEY